MTGCDNSPRDVPSQITAGSAQPAGRSTVRHTSTEPDIEQPSRVTTTAPYAHLDTFTRDHLPPPTRCQPDSRAELRYPTALNCVYQKTAAYGRFGREDADFTWEGTDKAAALRTSAGLA